MTVRLVLFVAVKVYVTGWPTVETVVGDADLVSARLPVWLVYTAALAGAEVAEMPRGEVPLAVAVSETDPLSRSACVTA